MKSLNVKFKSAFRQANPAAKFTDLFYKELVSEPLHVLQKIYQQHGSSITPQLQQQFMETEDKNTINRFGKHSYQLADFNLTREEVNKTMQFYTVIQKTSNRPTLGKTSRSDDFGMPSCAKDED